MGVAYRFSSGYEAAAAGRRLRNFLPSREHVNALIQAAGPDVIARARYLYRNNGYANAAAEIFVSNAIGTGITPVFKTTRKAAKKKLASAWNKFVAQADFDGTSDFYGLLRRAGRELFVAGEAFVRIRRLAPEDGLAAPIQLQLLPSEMLPLNKNEALGSGGYIRNGIEFDHRGRRVAYHFYAVHPGDPLSSLSGSLPGATTRVPAIDVIHLVDPTEAGQLRGISRFTSAIVKTFLLDVYDDAEMDRKKIAAMHALFITQQSGDMPYDPNASDGEEEEVGFELQPGLIVKLRPGEDVKTSTPADSGSSYEPFQYRTQLQISAATGIPYSLLSGDQFRSTYSSSRNEVLEFRRKLEPIQHNVFVFQLCHPVAIQLFETAVLSGSLILPGYANNRDDFLDIDWLPAKWDWIDPWRDAKAEVEQIEAGLKSRTQSVAERGYDVDSVDEERAAEQKSERERGIERAPSSPYPSRQSSADDKKDGVGN